MKKIRIYIYGAGAEYKKLLPKLQEWKEQIEVLGIVTTNDIGVNSMDGYSVIRPVEICQEAMDYVVIAVVAWKEILHTLLSYQIPKAKIIRSLVFYDLKDEGELVRLFERKNPLLEEKENLSLPKKKIWFEDFWPDFDIYHNVFVDRLKKHYSLVFDCVEPEYVLCSVYGKRALEYDAVRIIYSGENVTPDFTYYDYVFGYEYIQLGDRYFRWVGKDKYGELYDTAACKHESADINQFLTRDFCCRVVSNSKCAVREEFFEQLNKKCAVASGGRTKNNLQPPEPVKDKKRFLQGYQFDIAMENSPSPGYVSEKILQSWEAGCIPIYWGDPEIGKEYNEEAFVNCHRFSSVAEAVDYVLELAQDEVRLEKIIKAPIKKQQEDENKTLEYFFVKIMSQPKDRAYRRRSFYSCCVREENGMEERFSPDECMRITQVKE